MQQGDVEHLSVHVSIMNAHRIELGVKLLLTCVLFNKHGVILKIILLLWGSVKRRNIFNCNSVC